MWSRIDTVEEKEKHVWGVDRKQTHSMHSLKNLHNRTELMTQSTRMHAIKPQNDYYGLRNHRHLVLWRWQSLNGSVIDLIPSIVTAVLLALRYLNSKSGGNRRIFWVKLADIFGYGWHIFGQGRHLEMPTRSRHFIISNKTRSQRTIKYRYPSNNVPCFVCLLDTSKGPQSVAVFSYKKMQLSV